MIKVLSYTILLCLATVVANEAHYIIRPSQSQIQSCVQQCSIAKCRVDNNLTLSQFVKNSTDYLTNDTVLFFSPGNYSLKSKLIVENIHSFSMTSFMCPISSSKAVITCGHNARFEFRNVSIVTVSGFEFVGCFENNVTSVGRFQLENSGFLGNGQTTDNVNSHRSTAQVRTKFVRIVGAVIFAHKSNMSITHTKFINNTGNAIVYVNSGTITSIDHSEFINNTGSILTASRTGVSISHSKFFFNNGGLSTYGGGITIIDHAKFINNTGDRVLQAENTNVRISQSEFIGNKNGYATVHVLTGTITSIDHCKFINNTGYILLQVQNTNTSISQSEFIGNENGYATVHVFNGMITSIDHCKFINNTGYILLQVQNTNTSISQSKFIGNENGYATVYVLNRMITSIDHCKFINNTGYVLLQVQNMNTSISQSEFIGNENGYATVHVLNGTITSIDHSKFIDNSVSGRSFILGASNISMVSITHSDFVDNSAYEVLYLDSITITLHLSEFINNIADRAVVYIPYYTTADNLSDNIFNDNSAKYEVFIISGCRSDHGLSLGSSRCLQCPEKWHQILIGTVVAAFIAGIALIIFMLVLNMTVAVGTLNGILFYANIVAANADTYFLPFTTTDFVTVLISWLNLDIGFDICFVKAEGLYDVGLDQLYKALLQLAFPAYVIVLVIIVIVASECSSKFAKIIGKRNPVAVLATMILLSYAKFFDAILTSFSLLYGQPALGSHNINVTRLENLLTFAKERSNAKSVVVGYVLLVVSILILLLGIIFAALIFSWQWLLRYQDKAIFKWVRYQKLCHFIEPYHTPYTSKYRYWTGLLLFVRILIYLISIVNFSLDPRVNLMGTILVIGSLILLKGMTTERVYKNWPLDVMETAIYCNLVAFSALTWYNLDFGGDQVALAYTSVMIIFIFLLGVIIFHVLRYTRFYKCSFIEKAFKWTSSKLLEKKPKEQSSNDAPEELDGYQLERSIAGDQELPTITYSTIEIRQPSQNQEEDM